MLTAERILEIHYPTKRYVLSTCCSDSGGLEFFAPTHVKLPMRTPVRLLIAFGDTPERFQLAGRVSFIRGGSYGVSFEPGLGVAFEGNHKRDAAEMLAFCAGKPLSQGTASRQRVRTEIACRFNAGAHRVAGRIVDLSASGLFVSSPKIPGLKVGATLVLRLNPGLFGFGGKQLEVRVMWQGEKAGMQGFGGRFVGDPSRVGATLRKFLPSRAS